MDTPADAVQKAVHTMMIIFLLRIKGLDNDRKNTDEILEIKGKVNSRRVKLFLNATPTISDVLQHSIDLEGDRRKNKKMI